MKGQEIKGDGLVYELDEDFFTRKTLREGDPGFEEYIFNTRDIKDPEATMKAIDRCLGLSEGTIAEDSSHRVQLMEGEGSSGRFFNVETPNGSARVFVLRGKIINYFEGPRTRRLLLYGDRKLDVFVAHMVDDSNPRILNEIQLGTHHRKVQEEVTRRILLQTGLPIDPKHLPQDFILGKNSDLTAREFREQNGHAVRFLPTENPSVFRSVLVFTEEDKPEYKIIIDYVNIEVKPQDYAAQLSRFGIEFISDSKMTIKLSSEKQTKFTCFISTYRDLMELHPDIFNRDCTPNLLKLREQKKDLLRKYHTDIGGGNATMSLINELLKINID